MKSRNFLLGTAIAGSVAVAAVAQDSSGPITTEGYVELEFLDTNGSEDLFLFGDVSLSFASASGIGFDGSLVGVSDDDDSELAVYAALTYGFGLGKISLGVPRSAYGSLNNAPPMAGSRLLALQIDSLDGSLTEFTYLLADTDPPVGLRFDGDYGAAEVAASAHWVDDADSEAYALAFRYGVTDTVAFIADWEQVLTPGGNFNKTRAGAETDFGNWKGGLTYFNYNPGTGPHVDGTETWLTYAPTERVTVTGTAFNTNVVDIYGAAVRYDWPVGVYGQFGVADGRSIDSVIDLSVGFEF